MTTHTTNTTPVPTRTLRNTTLDSLTTLLKTQYDQRRDIIAGAGAIHAEQGRLLIDGTGEPAITLDGVTSTPGTFDLTEVAIEGLSDKLRIPLAYLRRLHSDHPTLFDANVNGWLQRDGRAFLLRCFGGQHGTGIVRAFLSDRYSIIDNYDVLFAALDGVRAAGVPVVIGGCDLTDRRMYVRIIADGVRVMAPALLHRYRSPFTGQSGADNPVVSAGIVLSNSEVGDGAFTITPRLQVQVCGNGLTVTRDLKRAVHLGGQQDTGLVQASEQTQRRTLDLIASRTTDAVRAFLRPEYAEAVLRDLEADAGTAVTDPPATIQVISQRLKFTDSQRAAILTHFIQGADATAGGILHAVTSVAQTLPQAEDAYRLESLAWEAMHLAATGR